MKKIIFYAFLLFITFFLEACRKDDPEQNVYEQDEQVIRDGIIYTYYTYENLYEKEIPFSIQSELSYYNYYYYDMSDIQNQGAIYTIQGELGTIGYNEDHTRYGYHFDPIPFYDYLRFCNPIYSPVDANFFRIKDYFTPTSLGEGFVVTGYTKELPKDVKIPNQVDGIKVTHIGYKALQLAPMESLIFNQEMGDINSSPIIHPLAISNCPNLKIIDTDARTLSMGVSNCPKLEKISGIRLFSDCSLYNLPSLTSILDSNSQTMLAHKNEWTTMIYSPIPNGIRKSSIYLCPKLSQLTGSHLKTIGNVVYYNNHFPFYVFDQYEIELRDDAYKELSYNKCLCLPYNPVSNTIYLSYLNNGLNYNGTFYSSLDNELIQETEDGFYIDVSYPKIIEGANFFSEEYHKPIKLKIIDKN